MQDLKWQRLTENGLACRNGAGSYLVRTYVEGRRKLGSKMVVECC